ncbi:MAG: histidine phosphatase family protein [Gammaproteobacteria bacterium]|nr:histidine phosphatase family protein [Gammaproteobacteria bacterium]
MPETDKHLYFIRHGQTEWNAVARMQGQWNSDLSRTGTSTGASEQRAVISLSDRSRIRIAARSNTPDGRDHLRSSGPAGVLR